MSASWYLLSSLHLRGGLSSYQSPSHSPAPRDSQNCRLTLPPFRRQILQQEFPNVPSSFIRHQVLEKKSLYKAYESIAESEGSFDSLVTRMYERLKTPRKAKLNEFLDMTPAEEAFSKGYGPQELMKELQAARKARRKSECRWKYAHPLS